MLLPGVKNARFWEWLKGHSSGILEPVGDHKVVSIVHGPTAQLNGRLCIAATLPSNCSRNSNILFVAAYFFLVGAMGVFALSRQPLFVYYPVRWEGEPGTSATNARQFEPCLAEGSQDSDKQDMDKDLRTNTAFPKLNSRRDERVIHNTRGKNIEIARYYGNRHTDNGFRHFWQTTRLKRIFHQTSILVKLPKIKKR